MPLAKACLCAILLLWAGMIRADPDRATFLELARKGWVFEIRKTMWRPDPDRPPIQINARDLTGRALCLIGEPLHPTTAATLRAYLHLHKLAFGQGLTQAGPYALASDCPEDTVLYLRLYSSREPREMMGRDLKLLDQRHEIGFSRSWIPRLSAPAQAQSYFGRRGNVSHLVILQPRRNQQLTPLQTRYFRSLLLEELYQSTTYGLDVLHVDRTAPFLSKLEEYPANLLGLRWLSEPFMQGMLASNSGDLCAFDLFMLTALAATTQSTTHQAAFLDELRAGFDTTLARARDLAADPVVAGLLSPDCQDWPE